MKDLKDTGVKPIIKTHYPVRERKSVKRWTIAMNSSSHRQKKTHNQCIEAAYMRIVSEAKKYYLPTSTVYFEKDHRQDRESAMAMHTFLAPDVYIHLQCNFFYDYEIEYAFLDHSYEPLIYQMVNNYPFNKAGKLYDLKPSFKEFYDSVIADADAAHVFTL